MICFRFSSSQAEWVVKQKIVRENEESALSCISDFFSFFFFFTEALSRERILTVSSEGLGFTASLSHPKFLANFSVSVSSYVNRGLKMIEMRTKRFFKSVS